MPTAPPSASTRPSLVMSGTFTAALSAANFLHGLMDHAGRDWALGQAVTRNQELIQRSSEINNILKAQDELARQLSRPLHGICEQMPFLGENSNRALTEHILRDAVLWHQELDQRLWDLNSASRTRELLACEHRARFDVAVLD